MVIFYATLRFRLLIGADRLHSLYMCSIMGSDCLGAIMCFLVHISTCSTGSPWDRRGWIRGCSFLPFVLLQTGRAGLQNRPVHLRSTTGHIVRQQLGLGDHQNWEPYPYRRLAPIISSGRLS